MKMYSFEIIKLYTFISEIAKNKIVWVIDIRIKIYTNHLKLPLWVIHHSLWLRVNLQGFVLNAIISAMWTILGQIQCGYNNQKWGIDGLWPNITVQYQWMLNFTLNCYKTFHQTVSLIKKLYLICTYSHSAYICIYLAPKSLLKNIWRN
jgi:hypothetical protein